MSLPTVLSPVALSLHLFCWNTSDFCPVLQDEKDQGTEKNSKKSPPESSQESKEKTEEKGEKDKSETENETKTKSVEPEFQMIDNPARVMPAQRKVLTLPSDCRYSSIKSVSTFSYTFYM